MQRRKFMQVAATSAALPLLTRAGRLFAAPVSSPRFLLVFLRGGYDCANLLVPYSSEFYYAARPNIAIAKPLAGAEGAALYSTATANSGERVSDAMAVADSDTKVRNAATSAGSQTNVAGTAAKTVPAANAPDANAASGNPGDPALTNTTPALALDSDWALAPALRDSIAPMYRNKEVAFVPFAGTDDLSRSHFETQDNIERGEPTAGKQDYTSGFMARLSSTLTGKAAPIAFTDALPLTFRGAHDIPNISLRAVSKPAFDERQSQILTSMYAGNHLQSAVSDGLQLREHVAKEFEDEMNAANRGAINARGFAIEAQRIGRLMREQYRLGFVDIGGWDTHVNEGGAQGALANNLGNLGNGLAAFAQELGPEWKNTVVVVVSEFGRTFRENGNRGTDHGHGSVYWVLGGGIDGGRVAGEQIKVQESTLLQNRDFPVLNNYRSLLAGLYTRMWGLSATQIGAIFPDTQASDLRLA